MIPICRGGQSYVIALCETKYAKCGYIRNKMQIWVQQKEEPHRAAPTVAPFCGNSVTNVTRHRQKIFYINPNDPYWQNDI